MFSAYVTMSDNELRSAIKDIILTHRDSMTRDAELRKVCTTIRQDLKSLRRRLRSMLRTKKLHNLGQHSLEHQYIAKELSFAEDALSRIPADSCQQCRPDCLCNVLSIIRRLRHAAKVCQNPPFRHKSCCDPLESLITFVVRDLYPRLIGQHGRRPVLEPTLGAQAEQYLKNHTNWRCTDLRLDTKHNVWIRSYECDLPSSILAEDYRSSPIVIRGEVDHDGRIINVELGEYISPSCNDLVWVWWTPTIGPASES